MIKKFIFKKCFSDECPRSGIFLKLPSGKIFCSYGVTIYVIVILAAMGIPHKVSGRKCHPAKNPSEHILVIRAAKN